MRCFLGLVGGEDGATAVEYAVMLALILMVVIGSIGTLGSRTGEMWAGINSNLQSVGFIR
ncbi:MAG TPA: Flp family type IVb pilin [Planctomycetaceae bacterium]|nr:Flp family type IVb pilin [Planctomycetaceae bacterium]